MELVPQTPIAVEFLQKWTSGPWILTAIAPVGNHIVTRTATTIEELETFLNQYNGKYNLYFTINKTRPGIFTTKPKKEDIREVVTFHCDVDPRIGEEIESERIRILKMLQEFEPRPSVILDSGGGYQCFFLLDEPISISGEESEALEAESYSVQLELRLGGDRTSNADRIMRIPGTINLPNEVKLKKGRQPALSKVVDASWIKYPLHLFTKAPVKIQAKTVDKEALPGGGERIKIQGNIRHLTIEDLKERKILISSHLEQLLIHCKNLENPEQYCSRSEALFAVVCGLMKLNVDDETIAGIIMNRENKISVSVLDKPRPERYCAKQIQNAKEFIDSPLLRELNSNHAVIGDLGGKCRIISEVYDHVLFRPRISYQSFDDFRNRYCNKQVQIATNKDGLPVYKPAGQWWISHAMRRQYDTVVFAPEKEIPLAYNLWQGFACESIPGDCSLFLEHVEKNICNNNEEHYKYLLGWMARCVQKPAATGEVAIVLRGDMGTGKGFFANNFGAIFGRHYLQVSDPKHLVGSFNAHLRDCIVLMADEAFFAGDKKHESVLKSLITEKTLSVEQKGVDVYASPNYAHIIMASNSNWVVPAGNNERRFFVLDVSNDKMQDKKYFSKIKHQMDNGGLEALLHFLMHYNINEFEVREVPKTEALRDQKLLSYSAEETWWYEKLQDGRILKDHDFWEKEVMKNSLQDDYILFMQRMGIARKASPTAVGKFLARVCNGVPKSYQKMVKVKNVDNFGHEFHITRRMYFYEIPELQTLRTHWDVSFGGPFHWNKIMENKEAESDSPIESVFK